MHWRASTKRTAAAWHTPAVSKKSSMIMQGLNRMIIRTMDAIDAALDWPINLIVRHFEKRLFELAMTVIMLGEALLLILSPASLAASSFHFMLETMSLTTCILLFSTLGVARIVALALNGHWLPYGAYVRAVGAVFGALMWGQMAAALLEWGAHTMKPVSPGIPVYITLALFEIISMYRALIGTRGAGTNY